MNNGLAPAWLVMVKVSVGKVSKTPRGVFRSLRVSSPVLMTVVVTSKLPHLRLTSRLGVESLTTKPRVVDAMDMIVDVEGLS